MTMRPGGTAYSRFVDMAAEIQVACRICDPMSTVGGS